MTWDQLCLEVDYEQGGKRRESPLERDIRMVFTINKWTMECTMPEEADKFMEENIDLRIALTGA